MFFNQEAPQQYYYSIMDDGSTTFLFQDKDDSQPPSTSTTEIDDYPPLLLSPFSPPTLEHEGFGDLLLAPHLRPRTSSSSSLLTSAAAAAAVPVAPPPPPALSKASTFSRDDVVPVRTRRKRQLRKDRHSKIATAQGLRDRRVRLSLDVADKFFGLQDKLRFDKASKTVDWLLDKSKKAIEKLAICSSTTPDDHHQRSSASNGAINIAKTESSSIVVSEWEVNSANANVAAGASPTTNAPANPRRPAAATAGCRASVRSVTATDHPDLVKQSRVKARARARDRTLEKKIIFMTSCKSHEGESNHQPKVTAPSSLHELEPSSYSAYQAEGAHAGDSSQVGGRDECEGTSFFDCNRAESFSFYQEQWSTEELLHGAFADATPYPRTWEGFNSHS